jgi:hypothetical protein
LQKEEVEAAYRQMGCATDAFMSPKNTEEVAETVERHFKAALASKGSIKIRATHRYGN